MIHYYFTSSLFMTDSQCDSLVIIHHIKFTTHTQPSLTSVLAFQLICLRYGSRVANCHRASMSRGRLQDRVSLSDRAAMIEPARPNNVFPYQNDCDSKWKLRFCLFLKSHTLRTGGLNAIRLCVHTDPTHIAR